ncbi:MAG: imidazole glycerol phosphate synthase subunit HisH [Candidatus Woesearchaeota archaeon]
MIKIISIIDYGSGNIGSVKRAFEANGELVKIVKTKKEILKAKKIVLPGVGSFGFIMKKLREKNLEKPLKEKIKEGTPYLGICLGLQILFEESEESPGIKGLCIFKGKVKKFKKGKIPQIGWNEIIPKNKILEKDFFYFVNSYYIKPKDEKNVASTTNYFQNFVSAIKYKNITAVQFHPEKSGKTGLKLLKRWSKC